MRAICDAHLSGRYHLEIVDLNQQPVLAGAHHVLATPTLVKDHPLPMRMLVGDMSDHHGCCVALDVRAADAPTPRTVPRDAVALMHAPCDPACGSGASPSRAFEHA